MRKNLPGKTDKMLTAKQKNKLREDWYERPEHICPNCGYSKKNCVCSIQKIYTANAIKLVSKI